MLVEEWKNITAIRISIDVYLKVLRGVRGEDYSHRVLGSMPCRDDLRLLIHIYYL